MQIFQEVEAKTGIPQNMILIRESHKWSYKNEKMSFHVVDTTFDEANYESLIKQVFNEGSRAATQYTTEDITKLQKYLVINNINRRSYNGKATILNKTDNDLDRSNWRHLKKEISNTEENSVGKYQISSIKRLEKGIDLILKIWSLKIKEDLKIVKSAKKKVRGISFEEKEVSRDKKDNHIRLHSVSNDKKHPAPFAIISVKRSSSKDKSDKSDNVITNPDKQLNCSEERTGTAPEHKRNSTYSKKSFVLMKMQSLTSDKKPTPCVISPRVDPSTKKKKKVMMLANIQSKLEKINKEFENLISPRPTNARNQQTIHIIKSKIT